MLIRQKEKIQLRINASISTKFKWATESNFLANFRVPANDLCVHFALPEKSERSSKFGSWPGFCRYQSKISTLKGKKLFGEFLKRDFVPDYISRETPPPRQSNVVLLLLFIANDGGGSGYYYSSRLFTLKSQREKTKEVREKDSFKTKSSCLR